jgi:hypothetical protein
MSSSPNLGIALLAQSQSSKYVTVNNAIDAIDGALTDVFLQAMADANQTPSTADAMSHMVIQCTGALTADRNLVLPNSKKVYAIDNKTTGSHNVVVKTSGSGSTVSIGAACKWVYCDGANNLTQIGS